MARKTRQYTITSAGRDQGKSFQLLEMPASQAEKWAIRAVLAMIKEGIELPDGIESAGFAGLARLGLAFIGKLPYEVAEPLLDEMFQCVRMLPNSNDKSVVRDLVESDIEEVASRLKLRLEVWKLHADFSAAAASSTLAHA
ncbi:hypothetical protein [Pseudomonas sp. GV071]|uniref:hypothetical protein n=1 Tax=Pseudomonas sp. GV071 TaxID=2135754 RepID=UPI000D3A5F14|nr:hypothetical protein [Pseudomonas sp. GV071]PTQ70292.1 hypothetical protein C8K61_10614 [Pseudomonas sp. GV071]